MIRARLVDLFAREYGWSDAEIGRMPMDRITTQRAVLGERVNARAEAKAPVDFASWQEGLSDEVKQRMADAQERGLATARRLGIA